MKIYYYASWVGEDDRVYKTKDESFVNICKRISELIILEKQRVVVWAEQEGERI